MRWRVMLLAALLAASPALASAGTLEGDEFRLEVPEGFSRAPDVFEQVFATKGGDPSPVGSALGFDPRLDKFWVYARPVASGGKEILTVWRKPGSLPRLDDAAILAQFREGLDLSAKAQGLHVTSVAPRRLDGDVAAFEHVMEGLSEGLGDVRSYGISVPRAGFVLALGLTLRTGRGSTDRAVWARLLGSLRFGPAPPPTESSGSPVWRGGLIVGAALAVAAVVWFIGRAGSRRRRREPPP